MRETATYPDVSELQEGVKLDPLRITPISTSIQQVAGSKDQSKQLLETGALPHLPASFGHDSNTLLCRLLHSLRTKETILLDCLCSHASQQ